MKKAMNRATSLAQDQVRRARQLQMLGDEAPEECGEGAQEAPMLQIDVPTRFSVG